MPGRLFDANPLRTLIWLAVVSIVVGFVLVTLRVDPVELIEKIIGNLDNAVDALIALGQWIFRHIGRYFIVGVVVVVPIWVIWRVLTMRKGR